MKKYTFYEWYADDEGGNGVCLTDEYCHNLDGYKTFKVGEFDTIEELANIFLVNYSDWFDDFQEAFDEAKDLVDKITF